MKNHSETTFMQMVKDSIIRAESGMKKYPQPNYVIAKFAEESGEVVKDAIHCAEGRQEIGKLRNEMIDSVAMLYRLWVEGDETVGLPPVQPTPAFKSVRSSRVDPRDSEDTAYDGSLTWTSIHDAMADFVGNAVITHVEVSKKEQPDASWQDAQAVAFAAMQHWPLAKRKSAAARSLGPEFARQAAGLYEMEEGLAKYVAVEKLVADFGDPDYVAIFNAGQRLSCYK
jgi:hypothetical protein